MQATTSYALIPKRRMLSDEYALYVNIPAAGLRTEHYRNLSISTAKIENLAVTTAKIALLAVENAQIGLLAVKDANIDTLTVTKLTTGNFTAIGTITTGSLVTGVSPNARIEITSTMIAGYSDATTKQFYLSCAGTDAGKAYAGAGAVILDSLGMTVKGQYALFQDSGGTLRGVVTGKTAVETGGNPQFQVYGTDGTEVVVYSWETLVLTGLVGGIEFQSWLWSDLHVDIGDATNYFGTIYANTLKVNTSIVPDVTGEADIGTTSLYFGTAYINTVTVGSLLLPDTALEATIGSATLPFTSIYVGQNYNYISGSAGDMDFYVQNAAGNASVLAMTVYSGDIPELYFQNKTALAHARFSTTQVPTAIEDNRGMLYYVASGAGVPDGLYCIMKRSDNVYSAVLVVAAP